LILNLKKVKEQPDELNFLMMMFYKPCLTLLVSDVRIHVLNVEANTDRLNNLLRVLKLTLQVN